MRIRRRLAVDYYKFFCEATIRTALTKLYNSKGLLLNQVTDTLIN